MSRFYRVTLLLFLLAFVLTSCKDRLDLENITLVLMLGIDLDEDNNLVIFSSSPVFSKEAKKKNETTKVKAITSRQARGELEARVSALVSNGKLQNILIGKKVLQHEGWMNLLDVFFRDSKARINARLIAVDGPVEEIMFFTPEDKRRLPLHIAKLIDTAHMRNLVEKTTLFEFVRLVFEKGLTPYVSEIHKTPKEVVVTGTALLDKKGLYRDSLDLMENELLQILQEEKLADLTLTLILPNIPHKKSVFETRAISFYVTEVSRKVKVSYSNNRFRFDIRLKLPIHLTEQMFRYDAEKKTPELEAMINKQLEQEMNKLVKKIQHNKLDPIGLGLYARAFQYQAWKKVQNDWGGALAKAEVNVHVESELKDHGEIK
ncbi:Ger(x)C family spore germination protein [Paenibacillus sp. CF384]|uniref:Ger(x)C family spore germination protein n=1 Tax=Paenibacillus sp. CF384 TaxID=1884382 RepID=UPI0008960DA0|nr:Ger(x)C family spore germination protein [Paenibacillus sp. CF384]SDW12551.1 germination protein, Ger(x)C family [Paenibacillus sp. CF384]